jgi:N-acetyl-gamma-glutamyl-phosphate reductase
MSAIRVAIVGATGYSGEELIRLLISHPYIQLSYLAASAKRERATPVAELFPRFAGRLNLSVESLDSDRLIAGSDAVFLALPHGASMALAPTLLAAGKRVVDLSGDFRLTDASLYPQWYRLDHAAPSLLNDPSAAYGLPEFHRERIVTARLIANPGCYATSILLGILPAFHANLVTDDVFTVDAKSGLSGAGRKADEGLLFSEMAGNLRVYKVNQHQHMPEVLQEIGRLASRRARMAFVPQVIPVSRGLISMIYFRTGASEDALRAAYRAWYTPDRAPFVRVRESGWPQLKDVVSTNLCDIGLTVDRSTGQAIVVSALDNLTKGAAGQAIQNLNLMCGWPETTGLLSV